MCETCLDIDRQIVRLKAIAHRMTDEPTLKAVAELVGELEEKKRMLHPEHEQ